MTVRDPSGWRLVHGQNSRRARRRRSRTSGAMRWDRNGELAPQASALILESTERRVTDAGGDAIS